MTILCPKCNFLNPPEMRFCGNCGSRLPAGNEPGAGPASVSIPLAQTPVDSTEENQPQELQRQLQEAAVLFVDLSGYTGIAEKLDSEDLYELVQRFLILLTGCVAMFGGVVKQYTGDGLIATFTSEPAKNHAEMALRAALQMQVEVRVLGKEVVKTTGFPLEIHTGLHSGPLLLDRNGPAGEADLEPATLGQTVHLARLLEEAAEPGTILVSERIVQQTQEWFDFEPCPRVGAAIAGLETCYRFSGAKASPAGETSIRELPRLSPFEG